MVDVLGRMSNLCIEVYKIYERTQLSQRCSYSHKDKCRHVSVWTIGPTVFKAMVLSRSDQPRIDEENIELVNRKYVSKHEQA